MQKYKRIFYFISSLYDISLAVWSGTIYLFMHQIGYTYGQINLFLSIFWLITFFTEIPSGYIADRLGYLKTIQISGFIRAAGLLVLAFNACHLWVLVISGILTALGDSLQSGTLPSWIANKAVVNKEKNKLGAIYSFYNLLSTPINMVFGFIGAQLLGNIDLKLPLIVGAGLLVITGVIVWPLLKYDSQNLMQKHPKVQFHLVSDVKTVIKHELTTFKLILLLLPITFISAGPLDQWQLYFQQGKQIKSGIILLAMGLVGMLGSLVYRKLSQKPQHELRLISICVLLMTGTICLTVVTRKAYYLSLALFLLHDFFGKIEQIAQDTFLQVTIETETRRATLISVSNALEAAVSVVILAINGYLSDHYGIGTAWISLAVVGILLFGLAYLFKRKSSSD
ncbi:MFS transporter [Lactobacillus sp. ESL0791]|uniref:MFS transporter n=1 Tax=Lactobacillus sp. ESL0791 TaxID=2983234 RepID=UPI0023F8C18B|nr:MFS transporter [Lactobacillus sp. ESL0791]MDF7637966.1 MFS transporter [Lactobacillus sp. ESL0791]